MQLGLFLRYCKKRVILGILAAILLVVGLGLAVWWVPALHQQAAAGYHAAQSLVATIVPNDGEELPVASTPPQTPDPIKQLNEKISELQNAQTVQKNELLKTQAKAQEVEDQLKAAVTEVIQTNDLLAEREKEWKNLLQKAGVNPVAVSGAEKAIASSSSTSPITKPASQKININTATAAQLDGLPGIGPTYAGRVVLYRQQHGLFKQIEELQNVKGIGASIFAKIKDLIEV